MNTLTTYTDQELIDRCQEVLAIIKQGKAGQNDFDEAVLLKEELNDRGYKLINTKTVAM